LEGEKEKVLGLEEERNQKGGWGDSTEKKCMTGKKNRQETEKKVGRRQLKVREGYK